MCMGRLAHSYAVGFNCYLNLSMQHQLILYKEIYLPKRGGKLLSVPTTLFPEVLRHIIKPHHEELYLVDQTRESWPPLQRTTQWCCVWTQTLYNV